MSTPNYNSVYYKTINKTCVVANIAYLILRVFYLILFIVCKLDVLIWYDAATIIVYLLCFLLIKKKKYYLYALVCGNEFFAFIITTTLLIGFSTGFHLYLIGLCIVSFFTSYFSKTKNLRNPVIWAVLSLIIYLVIFFVSSYNAPTYVIPKWLDMTLLTVHIVVVFLFILFYLLIFLKYALSLEKKIMNESRTDELTQISNRYGLYDYFAQEDNKNSKVLALFDIDNFKQINDQHGHITGDYILKRVAEIALESLKDSFVCRYGGEEFVIVLDKHKYLDKLEAFRKNIENGDFEFEGKKYKVTITTGVAEYSKEMTLENWVDVADEKMYTGKNTGKNKTVA